MGVGLNSFNLIPSYYKAGVENEVANALNRRVDLLSIMSVNVTGFERLKKDYESCPDFGTNYTSTTTPCPTSLDFFI